MLRGGADFVTEHMIQNMAVRQKEEKRLKRGLKIIALNGENTKRAIS